MKGVAFFDFEDLVGQECDFYGVDGQRFRLDDTTWEAVENESTGECEVIACNEAIEGLPIARVIVEHAAFDDESYELNDLHDDHCWLEFGAYYDEIEASEYATFYFDYTPKGPAD